MTAPLIAERLAAIRDRLMHGLTVTIREQIAIFEMIDRLTADLAHARATLNTINEIRNSIIGTQTVNWSEHVYPLVAALNAAGLEGMGYPAAKEHFGSLIERAVDAEEQLAHARERIDRLEVLLRVQAPVRARIAALEEELTHLWSQWEAVLCPACDGYYRRDGHKPDCTLAAALAAPVADAGEGRAT